jgi:uncharacterized repeat protein (TIGR03803 family)
MSFASGEVCGKFASYIVNRVVVRICLLLLAVVAGTGAAAAQIYSVVHTFSGGGDGGVPSTGLTPGPAGSFYGTTYGAGSELGTIFKLKPVGGGWILNTLYRFQGGSDGSGPLGRVAVASDETLYGTTYQGGSGYGICNGGCGTIFHLTPGATVPFSALSQWSEAVLYRFTGTTDGGGPRGDLLFDPAGNLYGTGYYPGVVYELMRSQWSQAVLYSPGNYNASSGMISDSAGNLYGISIFGGEYGLGCVYELSPSPSGWTAQILYSFTGQSDGSTPEGGLIMDSSGNLYGTTAYAPGYNGTVFELSPVAGGGWNFQTLYGLPLGSGVPGGPLDALAIDGGGNLYGTTYYGGSYGVGTVFELVPFNGSWTYVLLHDFTGGSDGSFPVSNLVFDNDGNLYGTASLGGNGYGVVFEIEP